MDTFEKFVLDKIKKEMAKKDLNNRDLIKLLKGKNYKEKKDDVWISQKLSGKRKLRIDEFGKICEKLEINPAIIFSNGSNPLFLKMTFEDILKIMAKSIADELHS